jgi:hypothetical protein
MWRMLLPQPEDHGTFVFLLPRLIIWLVLHALRVQSPPPPPTAPFIVAAGIGNVAAS